MAAFQQGLIFTIGASVIQENHEKKIFKFWQLLIGKMIFYWCTAILSFTITILAIEKFLEIPSRVPLSSFLILGGAFSFAIISFGAFLASCFNQEVNFVRASLIYPVPAFIFSGYTFPYESLSSSIQIIANVFPFTWFANVLRELLLIGNTAHFEEKVFAITTIGIFFLISIFILNFSKNNINEHCHRNHLSKCLR